MKTLIGVCMAAMALVGNGCMGNAKHAESVSGGTTDSLYLLVGSYARAQEEGIRVYVFNQETGKGTFRSGLSGISNPSFLTPVSYTHLTLPTILRSCRSRWSPYH